jgi:hypothetical protein
MWLTVQPGTTAGHHRRSPSGELRADRYKSLDGPPQVDEKDKERTGVSPQLELSGLFVSS